MKNIRFIILPAILLIVNTINAQTNEIQGSSVINGQQLSSGDEEILKAKAHISELLKNEAKVWKTDDKNNDKTQRYYYGNQKDILVLEDRIEFRHKNKKMNRTIYFSNLENLKINITTDVSQNVGVIMGDFLIMFEGNVIGKELVKELEFIRHEPEVKKYREQLTLFEPIATQYRALQVKPSIPEEQRKYIVQANGFNEQKMYEKAIELYKKAIEIDQTAYPAAYSNLALLSAQVNQFNAAIYYMKKYLMLEPQAEDARSAQDKIYLWEAQITQ